MTIMPTTSAPSSSPVTVSAIMPCRNEEGAIADCVHSILRQHIPHGELELIVSDGGSTDGTRAVLDRIARMDPRLRVIENPQRFVSSGLNAAIRVAQGAIIMRMDAHTIYAPDYIEQCLTILEQTGADNVGGPALTEACGYVQRAIAAAYHSRFAVGGGRFHDPQFEGAVLRAALRSRKLGRQISPRNGKSKSAWVTLPRSLLPIKFFSTRAKPSKKPFIV